MTLLARDARRVLFDASPLISLGQGGVLFQLAFYVGDRGAVTRDVHNELVRLLDKFPDLRTLARLKWPPGEPLDLPPALLREAEDLRRAHAEPGMHANANRGEIATALMAQHLGDTLTVMEDHLGKALCSRRSIPRISAATLVAEMVAAGSLGDQEGFHAYDCATPDGVGRSDFDAAVARAAAALVP